MYWMLDLEGEVHSIWVCGQGRLQECKGQLLSFEVGQGVQHLLVRVIKVFLGLPKGCGSQA